RRPARGSCRTRYRVRPGTGHLERGTWQAVSLRQPARRRDRRHAAKMAVWTGPATRRLHGMTYSTKEIFKTLQGEGAQAGRAAVFCRFAGCNLWSGRESDRAAAACTFCDTDFVGTDGPGGGKFASAALLADAIAAAWGPDAPNRYVVFTGGEPLLQLDAPLLHEVHARGFTVAIETNGTLPAPEGVDWICGSLNGSAKWLSERDHVLMLVYPRAAARPDAFAHLDFHHFCLHPMVGPRRAAHTEQAVQYCLQHPQWLLSLQTHKYIGIP